MAKMSGVFMCRVTHHFEPFFRSHLRIDPHLGNDISVGGLSIKASLLALSRLACQSIASKPVTRAELILQHTSNRAEKDGTF